jgi:hypothetical protein
MNSKFATDQLQTQIATDSRQIAEQEAVDSKLNAEIVKATRDLVAARETGSQEDIDENQARLDALLRAEGLTNAQILALRKKLADDTLAYHRKTNEDQEKIDQAKFQLEVQITQKSLDGIASQIDARYDNEKAAIQKTIDAINAKAQADVAAENLTSDTADQKAKVIAEINGRAALQAQQLADKQRQVDHQKAEFDKAKAIADIVINTAVAISKAYSQGPTGIATIPLIAALGAVEIAIVESQAIPAYKLGAGVNGQPKHPGGDAIVGDGGRKELAVTPSGDLIVTPSTATIMRFPRDTVVLPDANAAIDALIYSSFRGLEQPEQPAPDARILQATQQLIRENRRLQNIIANKRETHFHGSWAGWEAGYRSGSKWMNYVDEKTKF